jgi:hypothetical protein
MNATTPPGSPGVVRWATVGVVVGDGAGVSLGIAVGGTAVSGSPSSVAAAIVARASIVCVAEAPESGRNLPREQAIDNNRRSARTRAGRSVGFRFTGAPVRKPKAAWRSSEAHWRVLSDSACQAGSPKAGWRSRSRSVPRRRKETTQTGQPGMSESRKPSGGSPQRPAASTGSTGCGGRDPASENRVIMIVEHGRPRPWQPTPQRSSAGPEYRLLHNRRAGGAGGGNRTHTGEDVGSRRTSVSNPSPAGVGVPCRAGAADILVAVRIDGRRPSTVRRKDESRACIRHQPIARPVRIPVDSTAYQTSASAGLRRPGEDHPLPSPIVPGRYPDGAIPWKR